MRDDFGLSAQMVIRALGKVSSAYKSSIALLKKRNQKIKAKNKKNKSLRELRKCTFGKNGAFPYDARLLSYLLDDQVVSIRTLEGRIKVPFQAGEPQLEILKYQKGESDLVFIRGHFYVYATCDIPVNDPDEVEEFLGVDLGIVNIAMTSDGDVYKGQYVNRVRHRNRSLRKKLQKKGTKSAKRLLKKRSKKESRFANDVNHCISKQLVLEAKRTSRGIALEDLKGIREGVRLRKSQRNQLHNWSFDDLKQKIEYKCEKYGVPLVLVDPRNTSRTCPDCGHIDKENRKSQSSFVCQSCGFSAHADLVGATNISRLAKQVRSRRAASVNAPHADIF